MKNSNDEIIAEKFMQLTKNGPIYRSRYIKNVKCGKLKSELSERQFSILFAIKLVKKHTISELSELMNVSKSTLSIIISKMIKNGYIVKVYPEEKDDKRKVFFYTSELGDDTLKKLRKHNLDEFKYLYNHFTSEQRENLKIGIDLLKSVLDKKKFNYFNHSIEEFNANHNSEDEIENMAYNFALFFGTLIETGREIMKGGFNVNGNIDSLTKNQYHLLFCINSLKYDTVSKLENFLNSSGSTVSITISKLVKDGYLYKKYPQDGEDGRIVYIRLTEKGKESLLKVQNNIKNLFIAYLNTLDENKKEILNKAVDHLLLVFNI